MVAPVRSVSSSWSVLQLYRANATRQGTPVPSVSATQNSAAVQNATEGRAVVSAQAVSTVQNQTATHPADSVAATTKNQLGTTAILPDPNNNKYTAAELAVRSRMNTLDRAVDSETAKAEDNNRVDMKFFDELMEDQRCSTCEARTYQDGSDDLSVSFQTPQRIAPEMVASVVRGHELEHVQNERVSAKREGRQVVSQSVTLQNSICADCGKTYVSGGMTKTVTKAEQKEDMSDSPATALEAFGVSA